jgi:lipoyl(octanoyl) transferase
MPSSMNSMKEAVAPVPQQQLTVKQLGLVEYDPTWRDMQAFTRGRAAATLDELWLLQHPPVYTLGLAARSAHLPRDRDDIPVVHIDRGGQITYHGPGQVVGYLLLDMKRRGLAVRQLVRLIETAVIDLLAHYGIRAGNRVDAPGVYVGGAKVAAVGLRVTRGCCYHGLALNVDMDLSPFAAIDPCGYPGLAVTQLKDLGVSDSAQQVSRELAPHFQRLLA